MGEALLQLRGVSVAFKTKAGPLQALAGADLDVRRGETVALVGESGSGKTTLANAVMGLARADGSIRFEGQDLTGLSGAALKAARRRIGLVFQNPYASLDPRWRVGDILAEPLRAHRLASGAALAGKSAELLAAVGLEADAAARFPRQFSGGQRQRIAIARALALEPRLLILDEPVSALDVSIQAQIVALLKDIQARTGVAYLVIAHDLALVSRIADRAAVMYLGRIVEEGPARDVIARPLHPYTAALVAASPTIERALAGGGGPARLRGEPPSAVDPPSGCPFHPRCPAARERCGVERPALGRLDRERSAACHYPGAIAPEPSTARQEETP